MLRFNNIQSYPQPCTRLPRDPQWWKSETNLHSSILIQMSLYRGWGWRNSSQHSKVAFVPWHKSRQQMARYHLRLPSYFLSTSFTGLFKDFWALICSSFTTLNIPWWPQMVCFNTHFRVWIRPHRRMINSSNGFHMDPLWNFSNSSLIQSTKTI